MKIISINKKNVNFVIEFFMSKLCDDDKTTMFFRNEVIAIHYNYTFEKFYINDSNNFTFKLSFNVNENTKVYTLKEFRTLILNNKKNFEEKMMDDRTNFKKWMIDNQHKIFSLIFNPSFQSL